MLTTLFKWTCLTEGFRSCIRTRSRCNTAWDTAPTFISQLIVKVPRYIGNVSNISFLPLLVWLLVSIRLGKNDYRKYYWLLVAKLEYPWYPQWWDRRDLVHQANILWVCSILEYYYSLLFFIWILYTVIYFFSREFFFPGYILIRHFSLSILLWRNTHPRFLS